MSLLVCIKLFSEKSQIVLSASSLQVYPLHTALLNIDESIRRESISNGEREVANEPTRFHKRSVCAESDSY